MDLIEKYAKKVQELIEEARADGITIASYISEIELHGEKVTLEQGIAVMCDANYQYVPTWKVGKN